MVEENLDWQLAEEKTSLITLVRSPTSMHGGTAYPLTEKQEKIWALIKSLKQKIMKKPH